MYHKNSKQFSRIPHSQEAVLQAILEIFDTLPNQLKITARYIIDHPYEVGVQSMRALASDASVHPNSFMRLARQLGFAGYEQMRERFRDFVRNGKGSSEQRARWLQDMAKGGGSEKVVAEMASASLTNLEQMYQGLVISRLDAAADWMRQAERVYVLGVGSAYTLAYNFWYIVRMFSMNFVLTPRHGSLVMDDIVNIKSQDVLLAMTFQPYRAEIIEALRFANIKGARTIGLSDSPSATVFREATLGLHSPTHTPQFFHSNSALIVLLETLCALLVSKSGESAVANVKEFAQRRWASGIYEE